jgi:hypothetical protein
MSNAMEKLMESALRTARHLPLILLLPAFLMCVPSGCSGTADEVAETPKLEAPVVKPECGTLPDEATSLQRYQELNLLCQAEKSRNAVLESDLAQEQAARQKAEAEAENLRMQQQNLSAKVKDFDAMQAKLDEAQKASLAMESMLRDLRRDLLQERLAGVKRDETIVALKIERAKDARKSGAIPPNGLDRAADMDRGAAALPSPGNNPQTGVPALGNPPASGVRAGQDTAPPSQSGSPGGTAEKGTTVANP